MAESPGKVAKLQLEAYTYRSSPTLRRSPRKRTASSIVEDESIEDEVLVVTTATSRTSSKSRSSAGPRRENSSSPNKKQKKNRGYMPPEAYAHLKPLPDRLVPELDVVFCGINPGEMSAKIGFHYGNPSNKFWKCLHKSGFTPTLLKPQDGPSLPEKYRLGLTDLVERPTPASGNLSDAEKAAAVPSFLLKIHKSRPRILCFQGLEISRIVMAKACKVPASSCKKLPPGLLPFKLVHTASAASSGVQETLFFASPSPSGLNAGYGEERMVEIFSEVRDLLKQIKQGTCDTSAIKAISLPPTT